MGRTRTEDIAAIGQDVEQDAYMLAGALYKLRETVSAAVIERTQEILSPDTHRSREDIIAIVRELDGELWKAYEDVSTDFWNAIGEKYDPEPV